MATTFRYFFILFATCCFAQFAMAQEPTDKNWDGPKIKGARILPYQSYNGSAYLTDNWCTGKIELSTGEFIDNVFIKYSSYKDELFYYNRSAGSQINIDKATLSGFEFADADGRVRKFKKQYFAGYTKNDRFFEILSEGPVSLLAFRKTALNTTSPYHDQSGVLKNLEYVPEHQIYFYSREKGYANVKPNATSFLSKFEKQTQRPIKKLLRKNRIRINSEDALIQAWELVSKEGYQPVI